MAGLGLLNFVVIWSQFGGLSRLSSPISVRGDALFALRVFANLALDGSWSANGVLGWPAGQNLWDYPPVGDLGNILLSHSLVGLLGDPVRAMNIFFLAGFGLQYSVTFVGLKTLSCRPWVGSLCGVIFALLPYHFDRGVGHLFLSNYAFIMLVVTAAVRSPQLERLEFRHASRKYLPNARLLLWLALGLTASAFGVYYAVFSVVVLLTASLWLTLYSYSPRTLLVAISGVVIGLLCQVLLVKSRQSIELSRPIRQAWESDLYALKPSHLFTPSPWSTVSTLDSLRPGLLQTVQFQAEGTAALGTLLSAVVLIAFAQVVVLKKRRSRVGRAGQCSSGDLPSRPQVLALVLLLSVVAASVSGGVGSYLSYAGLAELRVWSRASVVVAAISVVLLGLTLENFARSWALISPLKATAVMVSVGIGAFELISVRSNAEIRSQSSVEIQLAKVAVDELKSSRSSGRVLQLPAVSFPEVPPVHMMTDYSHFLPTLFSSDFQWSYGNVRYSGLTNPCEGREIDIGACAITSGYDVIWIDRSAFVDGGDAIIAQITHELRDLRMEFGLGTPNSRYAFFALDA